MLLTFFQHCLELSTSGTPHVVVTLIEATGSTPQDAGSKMIVSAAGLEHGTVGGGKLEAKAIGLAQEMLSGQQATHLVDWNLKADVGMTCGGRVKLFFETSDVAVWPIALFGAGHVAQSLARIIVSLPCQVTCYDPRSEWLERLPEAVARRQLTEPASAVVALPSNSFVLCMTQGHATDRPILQAIYEGEREFPFVGVIGSAAKAAVLRKELAAAGIAAERLTFRCPVGLPIGTNHPAEIAVSIAAQLLEVRGAELS